MSSNRETQTLFESYEPPNDRSTNGVQPTRISSLEARELGTAVGRRTRSLIAPAPILEVERNKGQRELDLSAHDLRMLCLIVLDVVIDKMGFSSGAGKHEIAVTLAPILRSADPEISRQLEDQITE